MFELEHRYFVFKIKDVIDFDKKAPSTPSISSILNWCAKRLTKHREDQNKQELKCIVVESDWPEYQMVLEMLRNRIEAPKLKLYPCKKDIFESTYTKQEPREFTHEETVTYLEKIMSDTIDAFAKSPIELRDVNVKAWGCLLAYTPYEVLTAYAAKGEIWQAEENKTIDVITSGKMKFDKNRIPVQDRKPGDWYQQDGKTKVWNGDPRDPEYPVNCEWFQATRNR